MKITESEIGSIPLPVNEKPLAASNADFNSISSVLEREKKWQDMLTFLDGSTSYDWEFPAPGTKFSFLDQP